MSFEERNKHLSGSQLTELATRVQTIIDNPDQLTTRQAMLRNSLQSAGVATSAAIESKAELLELQRIRMKLDGTDPDESPDGSAPGNVPHSGIGGFGSEADKALYEQDKIRRQAQAIADQETEAQQRAELETLASGEM